MQAVQEGSLKAKSEVSITNKKINQQKNDFQELEEQKKIYDEESKKLKELKAQLDKEIIE